MVKAHRRRKPLELPRYEGPGKFEGEIRLSEFIWSATLEGGGDGLGDVQDFGYYSMVELGPEAVDDMAAYAKEADVELTADEREFIRGTAGAIVSEDNVGFVSVYYFDTKRELDEAWSGLEEDYDAFMGAVDEWDEMAQERAVRSAQSRLSGLRTEPYVRVR
jgi:hypothetical protein